MFCMLNFWQIELCVYTYIISLLVYKKTMDKKQYVLKVLAVMKDIRPIAEGLSYLIEKNAFDNTILDVLVSILQYSIKGATSQIEKEKLGKANEIFQKLKSAEQQQHKIDEQDIQQLEKMINEM